MAAVLVAACGPIVPVGPVMPPGSRQLVIPLANMSDAPATLAVTDDNANDPTLVGTAQPSSVAAGETTDVVFTIPNHDRWAIVVNGTTIIVPMDVGGRTGRLPISIRVDRDGNLSWSGQVVGP